MDVDDTNIFDTPLMVVQVTNSECGVCKFGTPSKEINFMSFNLGTLFPTKDLTAIHEPPIDEGKRTKSKLIARKFVYDEAAISRLREKFDSSDVLNFKPSRVEMITALLWRSLIRATRNPNSKRSIVSFPLNLRGKVAAFPETTNSSGISSLIKRDSIKETTSYCAKATQDEIVSLVVDLYNDSYAGLEWGGNKEFVNFTCSSLGRFPMQKVDFGWGKPSLMHFGS
ncbi:hypothetical protein P3S68_008260 [Capsicum galapagoense]